MLRVLRASALVSSVALVAGALVATGTGTASAVQSTTVAPTAVVASSISGWSTTAVTMKAYGEVSSAITVKPGGVRTGYVQAKKGATGVVANRTALTTSSTGVVAARFVPTTTGIWYVRVAIKATPTAAAAVTAWRKITVSGSAASSTLSTPIVAPSTVLKGASQKLTAVVRPAGARVVEFYGRAPGSALYVLRGRASSSSTGLAAFTWKAPTAGAWSYKAYVRPSLTMRGAWSLLRSATVTDLPAAVTNLTPVSSFDSIALTWTNPTTWLAKVVVRRTLQIDPPPATPTAGTGVALASDTATSVTDTGLPDQTEYRYTVFTLDSLGRHRPGVALEHVFTTDKPPAQVTGVSADVSVSATSATLTWTNPALDLDHVVVRRSLASDPAPTSVFEGIDVPLGSSTATTVTDTGLTAGTAYRWSIITVNDYGTPSEPVHVLATTMNAALTWSSAVAANPAHGSLLSLDCVGTSFCVALDQYGFVVEYNGSSWGVPTPLPGDGLFARAVNCQGSACVVSTLDGRIFRRAGAGSWTLQTEKDSSAEFAIACAASTTFCLAADISGQVRYSADGGISWSPRTTLPSAGIVYAIDCVNVTFCKLVGNGGKTWTFTGVSGGVPTFTPDTAVTTDQLASVDCVSTSFCVFLTSTGKAWKSGDVAATTMDAGNSPTDVSCSSETNCVAVDYTGRIVRFDGATWGAPVRPDSRAQLISVSCTALATCIAIDAGSFGWETHWNGITWSPVNPIDVYNGTNRVSCPTSSFCMSVDQSGRAVTFNGTSWSAPMDVSYPYGLNMLECASATLCFTGDGSGSLYRYDGSTWSLETTDVPGEIIRSVSCPTTTYCVFVTSSGRYSTWNGSSWTAAANSGLGDQYGISCATTTYCGSLDSSGTVTIFDGNGWVGWTGPGEGGADMVAVECPLTGWCMGLTGSGQWTRKNGATWTAAAGTGATTTPSHLSCTSTTSCTAVSGGFTLESVTWDGSAWHSSATTSTAGVVVGVSCTTHRWCLAVDSNGNAYTGTR